MKNLLALIIIGILILSMPSCTVSKLHNGWYTYNQLQRKGYTCEHFTGSKYIRATADSLKANIVKQ